MNCGLFVLMGLAMVAGSVAADVDYGAGKANTTFYFDKKDLGGKDDFDYLALRDHCGPTGVQLGGIGLGYIDFAPDGSFTRVALTNTHRLLTKTAAPGCFFSLWEKTDGRVTARRLVRDAETRNGMGGYRHSTYTGLFPIAEVSLDNDEPGNVKVSITAHSGLVPHNTKDSSLPVAWFEVTLSAKEAADVAVALSWEDFIGRGLRDPVSLEGMYGQIFEGDRFERVNGGENWPMMPVAPTEARAYQNGAWQGILQHTLQPMKPKKLTFQNYFDQVAIVAQTGRDVAVSTLPAYPAVDGAAAWDPFTKNGAFATSTDVALSKPDGPAMASGVAISTKLKKGETKTVRFMVAWYAPDFKIDYKTAERGSYWSTCDYGRYYHNFFDGIDSLVSYAGREGGRILAQTREWQKPVLDSTMPDWLKFKLINSAYTMFTNTLLNKAGCFTVMEGAMAGLAGTMDQRISAHPFYQKFFTDLDRSEMQLFANNQDKGGHIQHFVGMYYVGMASKDGPSPTQGGWMLDNTAGWIIQLAKDYAQTGDMDYLKRNVLGVKKGLAALKSRIKGDVPIPTGAQTYDDYHHSPIFSYTAGVYLTTLRAGAAIGNAVGDTEMARECDEQYDKSREAMMRYLWNGKYFAEGCELDGSGRRDDRMFTGQLAGQFLSRYCGWGDIVSMDVAGASLVSQFKTSLSHTGDYYANKMWDMEKMEGKDQPGSQCWPFYLESYTAMTAIQAGYVEDGLDIMKHIQLVHLRLGLTWSQNLWNPGSVTYMTAPVTWFITDVLAGSNLNVPAQTLYLAPVAMGTPERVRLPIYFPNFWAMLECDPSNKKASLRILKTFGAKPVKLKWLRCEPAGVPTSEASVVAIPEFTASKGSVLDLSPYWSSLWKSVGHEAVLPRADKVDYIVVK